METKKTLLWVCMLVVVSAYAAAEAQSLELDFAANPTGIGFGESVSLTWAADNASSCTAEGDWSGAKNVSGTVETEPLTRPMNYTLTCTNGAQSVSESILVIIGGASGKNTIERISNDAISITEERYTVTENNSVYVRGGSFFLKIRQQENISTFLFTIKNPNGIFNSAHFDKAPTVSGDNLMWEISSSEDVIVISYWLAEPVPQDSFSAPVLPSPPVQEIGEAPQKAKKEELPPVPLIAENADGEGKSRSLLTETREKNTQLSSMMGTTVKLLLLIVSAFIGLMVYRTARNKNVIKVIETVPNHDVPKPTSALPGLFSASSQKTESGE